MSPEKRGAALFAALSIVSQCVAFLFTLLIANFATQFLVQAKVPILAVSMHAIIAFMIARLLTLPGSWQLLNFLIPFLLYLSLDFTLPTWLPLSAVILALLIYIPTVWTRVPYYPTSRAMYSVILGELPTEKEFSFIDLGCGFGQPVSFLAARRPNGKFVGVEVGPLPYFLAKLRFLLRRNARIELQSLWKTDLSKYDFVYAFLAPGPMPALWEKAKAEMKSGSVFLTNTFATEEMASKVIPVADRRKTKLFVHRM